MNGEWLKVVYYCLNSKNCCLIFICSILCHRFRRLTFNNNDFFCSILYRRIHLGLSYFKCQRRKFTLWRGRFTIYTHFQKQPTSQYTRRVRKSSLLPMLAWYAYTYSPLISIQSFIMFTLLIRTVHTLCLHNQVDVLGLGSFAIATMSFLSDPYYILNLWKQNIQAQLRSFSDLNIGSHAWPLP